MREDFRRLLVWRRAKALAVIVYRVTGEAPLALDWALRDQMRRSAISIPSNIAEGSERGSDKDANRFFRIATGSSGELATQVEIALELNLLSKVAGERILHECGEVAAMLGGLIAHRQRRIDLPTYP